MKILSITGVIIETSEEKALRMISTGFAKPLEEKKAEPKKAAAKKTTKKASK